MLTKEQIAGVLNSSPVYDASTSRWARAVKGEYLDALCEMALGYLAMQPRPIAEAPKDGTWILGRWPTQTRWTFVIIQWMYEGWHDQDGAMCSILPTHFIPLSALQKVKP